MYNLLVTAAEDAWDKSHYQYDGSRFLEYTNEKIAVKFKDLTDDNIEELKSFPCIFAYEGERENIRIGYLKSIKERGRAILIEYSFEDSIPEIPFSSIKPVSLLLDIRDWEMSRTHWAVKDEDLFERLKAASLIDENFISPLEKPKKALQTAKIRTPKVTTVQGFIEKVLAEKERQGFEVFYRGHSDKQKYKLEPSLFRKDEDGNYLYLDNEHILYRELLVSNSSDFSSDLYTLDKLVRMQHYSLPTRLLDITSNPLIALYFACKSKFGTKKDGAYEGEEEGEVILFFLKKDLVKYFDSDTASCIANLARLPKGEKDSIAFPTEDVGMSSEVFNGQPAMKRLIHFIKEEKSFFEPKIIPKDLRSILCVKSKKSNTRITFQSGAFLLFGLDAILDEKGSSEIQIVRISVAHKASILKQLDLLNINESTVFPYIENSARYVAQKYAFNGST